MVKHFHEIICSILTPHDLNKEVTHMCVHSDSVVFVGTPTAIINILLWERVELVFKNILWQSQWFLVELFSITRSLLWLSCSLSFIQSISSDEFTCVTVCHWIIIFLGLIYFSISTSISRLSFSFFFILQEVFEKNEWLW